MNYAKHINELHTKEEQNSLLHTEPVLFSKFDSSIIQPGKPFFVPDFAVRFDYETEIVVKIAHVGKDISERFAHRYWNELTVGIDFTARELQKELREKGMPWECCKGFDGSAALGKFITKEDGTEQLMKILFYFHNDQREKDYYFLFMYVLGASTLWGVICSCGLFTAQDPEADKRD